MKAERLFFLPLIVLCLSLYSHSQLWSGVLDPTRAANWTQMGAGTIPTSYVQVGSTIAAYSGNTNTINNALDLCDGTTGQYVLLGPGTFNLTSGGISDGIRIRKNRCVLRGSGPTQTRLVFGSGARDACGGELGNICLISSLQSIDPAAPANVANWTAGFAQGSTQITLSANITGSVSPVVGQTLFLDQLKDGSTRASDTGNVFVCMGHPDCTQSGGGGDGRNNRPQMQYVTVTSIAGGSCVPTQSCTVSITPPIYMPNWRSGQSPQAWWANNKLATGQGVENLSADGSASTTSAFALIATMGVQNAWIKNIIGIQQLPEPVVPGSPRHFRIFQSHHLTIRDSYFVGRAGQDSYGVNLYLSGDVLIENNIFQRISTPIVNEQSYGNVYGYNFIVNDFWVDGTWAQGAIYGHGGQENYSLSEGNIAYGQEFENYFGEAFFVTAFRNRFYGFQNGNSAQTVPALVYGLNRYFNFVGNVLGTSGYHNNYQMVATGAATSSAGSCVRSVYAIGLGGNCANGDNATWPYNDTLTASTLMRWGNYDVVTAANRFDNTEVPSGLSLYANAVPASHNLPASFYLNAEPAWWPSGKAWPNIGPDVTGGNVGQCASNSAYPYAQCIVGNPNACGTGFACGSAGINSQVVSNPAMDCYFSLGGAPDGKSGNLTNFDAKVCYGDTSPAAGLPSAPEPPTGLNAQVQ